MSFAAGPTQQQQRRRRPRYPATPPSDEFEDYDSQDDGSSDNDLYDQQQQQQQWQQQTPPTLPRRSLRSNSIASTTTSPTGAPGYTSPRRLSGPLKPVYRLPAVRSSPRFKAGVAMPSAAAPPAASRRRPGSSGNAVPPMRNPDGPIPRSTVRSRNTASKEKPNSAASHVNMEMPEFDEFTLPKYYKGNEKSRPTVANFGDGNPYPRNRSGSGENVGKRRGLPDTMDDDEQEYLRNRRRGYPDAMDDDEQEYLRKYRQSRQKTQDTTTPANTIDDDIIAFIKAFFGLILAPLKIFKGVILLLRVPITFLIFLYVLFLVIITSGRVLFTAAGHALAPICNLPGLENLPFCGYDGTPPDWLSYTHWVQPLPGKEEDLRRPDFPRLIDLQTKFMGVIETAEASSIMGIELKNAELSIRDLGSLVSLSDLKCKDLLNDEIGRFVRDSKILTNLLRRLEAGVGGVVDRTVIMNNYAIFELDRVRNIETEGGSGYFQVLFLKPFFFRNPQLSPIQQVRLQISAVFLESSTRLEKELRKLIEDAEVILDRLEQLEKHLSNIYTIINTENKRVTGEQDRVLAEIWTMLGGNKRKIKNFNRHQNLLENVGEYRARALEQVGRTLVQLQGMYAGLEELKSSTSRDVIGDDSSAIPIEVHIQALREGALRLGQNKDAARENFLRKKKKALEKFSQFDLPDEKPLTRGIADQPGPQKRKYTAPGK